VPCAAGYAWGEDGSNQCPASYYRIVNAAACESAAAAAGKAYLGSFKDPDPYSPSGCYFYKGNDGFYFNADAVGAGKRGAQLLCSGAARSRTRRLRHFQGTHGLLLGYSRATIGYSRATMGYTRATMGYSWGTMGYSRATMWVQKYPASELKEAHDAAHGHLRMASLPGLEGGGEGMQEVLWVLHRPLGY
jgi:hypothetical protein